MLSLKTLMLPANLLSLARLFIGPAVLISFSISDHRSVVFALVLVILAELTDIFDGIVARRLGHVTDLGKLLDPMADSMYRFCIFLAFFGQGAMDAWMIGIIFGRDLIVAYTRVYAATRGIVLAARFSGKLKAVVQGVAQVGLIAMLAVPSLIAQDLALDIGRVLLYIAVLVTAFSAIDYVIGTIKDTARAGERG
jgi:CDP-diacylglycerol--glycerol-3-phosphate 3-phosphatidyltransferase